MKGNGKMGVVDTSATKARRPPQRDLRAHAAGKPAVENPGENPGGAVQMREQAHGGALRTGGTNRGGPGRPTNAVREVARLRYEERIPVLCDIADAKLTRTVATQAGPVQEEPSFRDRIMAIAELGKVGLGSKVELEEPGASQIQVSVVVGPELLAEQPTLAGTAAGQVR